MFLYMEDFWQRYQVISHNYLVALYFDQFIKNQQCGKLVTHDPSEVQSNLSQESYLRNWLPAIPEHSSST